MQRADIHKECWATTGLYNNRLSKGAYSLGEDNIAWNTLLHHSQIHIRVAQNGKTEKGDNESERRGEEN